MCPCYHAYVYKFTYKDEQLDCIECDITFKLKSSMYVDFFAIMDVLHEISSTIEENIEHILSIIHNTSSKQTNMSDFTDGFLYKRFCSEISDDDEICNINV